ncbi:MAG: recombination protein F [Pseudomonadota bacterium]
MFASTDFGARLLAAVSALVVTTAAMATAIIPASPATTMIIRGLA